MTADSSARTECDDAVDGETPADGAPGRPADGGSDAAADSSAAGSADGSADGSPAGDGPAEDGREVLEQRLAAAETAWLALEVEVETLRVELDNFALLHHQRLGPMYVHLDEIDALIAEAVAAHTGDPEDIRRAYLARSVVTPLPDLDALMDAAAAAGADGSVPPHRVEQPRRVRPGKEAQRLYRELARAAHPDLTTDPEEKERRSAFIARVNDAYARGDAAALETLSLEWAAGPEAAPTPQGDERTAWLRQRLEWLDARITALARQREELASGPMGQLLVMAPDDPDRLLEDLAEQLLATVAERQGELDRLLRAIG